MNLKLEEAIDLYLDQHIPTTRKSYQVPLKKFEAWIGPARPITEITELDTLRYNSQCLQKSNYAPATMQKHIKSLRALFNWFKKMNWITSSPVAQIKIPRVPRPLSRDKAMSEDNFTILLRYFRDQKHLYSNHPNAGRDYALHLFLADTGCRRGGACGLKMSDIDWLNRQATVTEKGEKTRLVKFGNECAQAMFEWRNARRADAGEYFWTRDGHQLKPDNITLIYTRARKALQIDCRGPHSLRHRKGHQMADAGIAPSITATALGHENVEITLKWYYPDDWETAAKHLDQLSYKPSPSQEPIPFSRRKKLGS